MYRNIHHSTAYNSFKVKTTQIFIINEMEKNCGLSIQWNSILQWKKLLLCEIMKINLIDLYLGKEARHKSIHSVCFHFIKYVNKQNPSIVTKDQSSGYLLETSAARREHFVLSDIFWFGWCLHGCENLVKIYLTI